jgi:hypothetical protein
MDMMKEDIKRNRKIQPLLMLKEDGYLYKYLPSQFKTDQHYFRNNSKNGAKGFGAGNSGAPF